MWTPLMYVIILSFVTESDIHHIRYTNPYFVSVNANLQISFRGVQHLSKLL